MLTTGEQKSYARSKETSMDTDRETRELKIPLTQDDERKVRALTDRISQLEARYKSGQIPEADYKEQRRKIQKETQNQASAGELSPEAFYALAKKFFSLEELLGGREKTEEGKEVRPGERQKEKEKELLDDMAAQGYERRRAKNGEAYWAKKEKFDEVSQFPPSVIEAYFRAQNSQRYKKLHDGDFPTTDEGIEQATKLTSEQESWVARGKLPGPISGGETREGEGVKKELTPRDQLIGIKERFGEQTDSLKIDAMVSHEIKPFIRLLGQEMAEDVRHELEETIPDKIIAASTVEQKRIMAQHLVDKVLEFYPKDRPKTERGLKETPLCLEDLAELIMHSESDEWQPGGAREIMNKKDELVPENFLAWVRKQMLYWHDFDATAETDFFSKISTAGTYRVVSLNEMLYHTRYFRKRERRQEYVPLFDERMGKLLKDEKGKQEWGPDLVEHYHEDEVYNALKEEILLECWLFNTSRNMDIKYRFEVMGSDENLPKLLGQLYAANVFTRANNLEKIFTLPTVTRRSEGKSEKERKELFKSAENHKVGDITRKAFLAYYFLPDIRQLRQILGHDSTLFRREYIEVVGETQSRVPRSAKSESGIGYKRLIGRGEKWKESWYDGNGVLKNDDKTLSEFSGYINFFAEAMEDPIVKKEVRDRIVQSLMPSLVDETRSSYEADYRIIAKRKVITGSIEEGEKLSDEEIDQRIEAELDSMIRQRAYQEAKYADEWAFSMMRWTLAASKNDTNGIGFDAATKITRTEQYRTRQAAAHRMGALGNMYNIPIFKSIGLDMFNAILTLPVRDENGDLIKDKNGKVITRTPIEILLAAQNAGSDKEAMAAMNQLRFLERTMTQYHADHVGRSFEVFHSLIGAKEIKLEELAKIDPFRGVTFDQAKFQETVIDGFLKSMRYAYSTWRGVDFSKKIRYFVRKDEETGEMIFEDRPLVNVLFSKEVVEGFVEKFKREISREDYDLFKGQGVISDNILRLIQFGHRDELWKEVAKLRLAAEIYSHRDLTGPNPWLTTSQIETIYAALQKIPGNLLVDKDEKDFKKTMVTKLAFDNKDINWMRKKSRTEVGRMVGMDTADALTKGSFVGFWEAAKVFFADITK